LSQVPTLEQLPNEVFRDYDIRGLAYTQITTEFAARLGAALAIMFKGKNHNAIYVGRDCRLNSEDLSTALCQGLLNQDMDVIDLGAVSTPVVNYSIHCGDQADVGIMITASHNPKQYNGFKIVVRDEVIDGDTLQKLKQLMHLPSPKPAQMGQLKAVDMSKSYLDAITQNCNAKNHFKIVVDAGNAVAGPLAEQLFTQLGYDFTPIFCTPDGEFPNHDPNPSDENNLIPLKETVAANKADLGFALDGDGDRLVVITGSGAIVWPDQLMMIFAEDILRQHPKSKVVFDVKSSNRLSQLITDNGGVPVMCKTGHSHVRRAVNQTGALIGGEFSGHIFFNDRWHGFDDGIYAAMRLLEILSDSDKDLDEILNEFSSCADTPEILIPVSETEKFKLIDDITSQCHFLGAKVNTIDGLRVEYAHGWGLIRASNTSAYLTMRFEAENREELARIKKLFITELKPFINNVEDYL
jgi:phosphomannomutase/phosphoglucomutase